MTRMRLILPSLLATIVVTAIAATPASAHAFKVAGTEVTKAVEAEETTVTNKLESTISKTGVLIECGDEADTNVVTKFEEKGKLSGGELKFGSCIPFENSKGKREILSSCTVSGSEFKYKGELINGPELEIKGEKTEEEFGSMEIAGTECSLKGSYALKGSADCVLPAIEFEEFDHEFYCVNSKLKLGGEKAKLFDTELFKPKSDAEWNAN
jgi:hypothetical protein